MSEELSIEDAGALFQIAEPGESVRQTKRRSGRAIGIDLGTTHSLVAIAPEGMDPRVLPDGDGRSLLPSVVSYAGETPVVGAAAREQAIAYPQQVVSSVKRFMGRGLADIDFPHPYRLSEQDSAVPRFELGGQGQRSAVEVSADILRALKDRALAVLGGAEEGDTSVGAVVTVPAYFDDAQRQATKDAARIAGLEVYRLLAEPTAAALAYGLDRGGQGLFAVYDLGGGTFDISVLRLRDGVFQVLATGGDSALGGDDFDRVLAERFASAAALTDPTPAQRQELMAVSRATKEKLSDEMECSVSLETAPLRDHRITREEFEQAIAPLLRRSLQAVRRTLKDAELKANELQGVVLVGGSTRVPAVRAAVEKAFGRPPLADIDPDKVVAYGAAVQADILSGSPREGVTLLDVVPLSLGLETMGGIVEKLIPRNAAIPVRARQVFTNYSEKQTGMSLHVVQGERELAGDCRSLARFELKGMPQLPPSMARVEVIFELDADALLTVTAKELMTGVRQQVEVKPTYGMSEDEVEGLIADSLEHAREDFAARNVAEAKVELGRVVLAIRTALQEVGHVAGMLLEGEQERIAAALREADEVMSEPADADRVNEMRKRLEATSEDFARRRMERALRSGMSGKSLVEIEQSLAEEAELAQRRASHEPEQLDS